MQKYYKVQNALVWHKQQAFSKTRSIDFWKKNINFSTETQHQTAGVFTTSADSFNP
jgi:hypothetical protein